MLEQFYSSKIYHRVHCAVSIAFQSALHSEHHLPHRVHCAVNIAFQTSSPFQMETAPTEASNTPKHHNIPQTSNFTTTGINIHGIMQPFSFVSGLFHLELCPRFICMKVFVKISLLLKTVLCMHVNINIHTCKYKHIYTYWFIHLRNMDCFQLCV